MADVNEKAYLVFIHLFLTLLDNEVVFLGLFPYYLHIDKSKSHNQQDDTCQEKPSGFVPWWNNLKYH